MNMSDAITHFAPAYPEQDMDGFAKTVLA